MPALQFVPWRKIASWRCRGCGDCCKKYSVVLNFPEWYRIAQTFGGQATVAGMDRFFLKRVDDGSCAFLCSFAGSYLCGLQNMKPDACRLWPFKVLSEPKYGESNQAALDFMGKRLYVYADSNCSGLRFGNPTWEFSSLTLKEFAAIAMGVCPNQQNSTRSLDGYGSVRFRLG